MVMTGVSLLILAALVSYHPLDPTFWQGRYSGAGLSNWAGIVGASLGDGLIGMLGLAAFWVPGIMIYWSVKLFRRSYRRVSLGAVVGLGLLIPASAGLITLFWPKLIWAAEPVSSGGWVGAILIGILSDWFNPLGAGIILIATFLAGLSLALDMSLLALAQAAQKGGGSFFSRLATAKIRVRDKRERSRSETYLKLKEKMTEAEPRVVLEEPRINESQEFKPVQDVLPFMSSLGHYSPPQLSFLEDPPENKLKQDPKSLIANSRRVEKKLFDFGVEGRVQEVNGGPVITMYEFAPAPGVKISKIANLADDLTLALRSEAIRVVGPLPGKGTMGIEIPNSIREVVYLKEIIAGKAFQETQASLPLILGKDAVGRHMVTDLTRMPHLLIAGATGSGKSVCLNTMLMSILYRSSPLEVRLLMVDPKRIELSVYDGIPHLLHPVVIDPQKATKALRWAVLEMERRYELLARANVRSIDSFNRKAEKGKLDDLEPLPGEEGPPGRLPAIIIVIDELADLMMVSSKEVEDSLRRLAQMARAAGIHMILATQRPSVDVLTGVIKANFPARIAFQVASKTDSRTILDANGAESLLGAGDMLFLPPGVSKLTRVHGAFVSDSEVQRVTNALREQGEPQYNEDITKVTDREGSDILDGEEMDDRYQDAVQVVVESGKASISLVQRKLRVGYNRAARMIEMMAAQGIISEPDHTNTRRVILGSTEEVES